MLRDVPSHGWATVHLATLRLPRPTCPRNFPRSWRRGRRVHLPGEGSGRRPRDRIPGSQGRTGPRDWLPAMPLTQQTPPCKHHHTHNSAQWRWWGGTRTPGGPRPRSACAQQAFQLIDSAGKMFPSWAGRAVALLVRIPASGPPSPPSPPAPRNTPSDKRHSREPLSSSLDASSLPTEQNGKDALLCTGPLSTNNRFSKKQTKSTVADTFARYLSAS